MSEPISIEALSVERFADWERLWRDYQTFYGIALCGDVRVSAWKRLVDKHSSIHGALATNGGRAIGLVHWFYHPSLWREDDVCYLQDLFVEPKHRGSGTGRLLIEHVYEHAEDHGAPEVYWHTHESNRKAMRLYDQIATASGFIQYKKMFELHPTRQKGAV